MFRIRTERSSATSLPEPRTSHNISNVEITEQDGGTCKLRFNWFTLNFRYKTVDTYFGTFLLHARRVRGAAVDQAQEGRAEERLHPPRHRRVPHLMAHSVALNFEDGVTRIIETRPNETVADASYRVGINIPLDCRDGACGTCRVFCEAGQFDGGSYIEDALTDDEAAEGYGLACQMRPRTDLVLRIAASSDVCKVKAGAIRATLASVTRLSPTTLAFALAVDPADRGGLPAGPVCQRAGARHGPEALLLVQLRAGCRRVGLPRARHPRRADEPLPARSGTGHGAHLQRPIRQLLPARYPAAPAVPGGRHRAGTLPVDARPHPADRGAPSHPHDLRRDHRRRPGRAGPTGCLRRRHPGLHLPRLRRRCGEHASRQGLRHPLYRAGPPPRRRRGRLSVRPAADGGCGARALGGSRA